jgi:V/A-type H+-transporting ATPase subunit I
MIVGMKKVSIVVMDKTRTTSLEYLRELGVVHLEKRDISSEKLLALFERKQKIETAQGILRSFAAKKPAALPKENIENLTDMVLELFEARKAAQEAVFSCTKEISRIEKWGNFHPEDIQFLAEKGVNIYPYELSHAEYEKLGENVRVIVLGSDKASVYCVVLENPIEGRVPFVLPEKSLVDLQLANTRKKTEVSNIEERLTSLSVLLPKLAEAAAEINKDVEFETAHTSMNIEEDEPAELTISWIQGYVPVPELGVLKRAAAEQGWALYACSPAEDDRPPTLTKNNAFVRIIKPLFDFLGTVPGYREYDISPSYLIFFCIFFAMIFGDAAYGSIIFAIVAIAGLSIKAKTGKLPDAIKLFGLLSLCTIVWGAVNGSWFAVPYENLPAPLKMLVLPQFNSNIPLQAFPTFMQSVFKLPAEQPSNPAQWNVQFLCFSIAVVQLVYSHIKNIKKVLCSPAPAVAVAQAGWLVMMVGLYFLVLFMLLKMPLPSFALYLIVGGLGAYFIFACQTGGNVIKNVGRSFANFLPTFLNAVSSFADIISYIRLFAVGLAGSSIAQSFNAMSGLGGIDGTTGQIIGKTIAALLILLFGHSLNMVMNALSVVVHGVRLNLLEYAGNHLGMEWSGYAYKPFALARKDNK